MSIKLPLVFACSLVPALSFADPVKPMSPSDPASAGGDEAVPPIATTTTTTTVTTGVDAPVDTTVPGAAVPGVATTDAGFALYSAKPHRGPFSYAWSDPDLASGIGIGFTVGGGLTGFTDRAMRDTVTSRVDGLWAVRASFGTHIPIGVDVGYIGSAANINTIAGSPNGTLIGSTAEAVLRYNILPHNTIDPYIFAGVGWSRYDVRDLKFAQSDTGVASHDSVFEIPGGAGIALRDASGFNADLRGTFRATQDSTLLQEANGDYAHLYSWEASGSVGYEF